MIWTAHPRALREEARKSWDYVATDECVYFMDGGEFKRFPTPGALHLQRYREGSVWLEAFCLLAGDGISGDYAAILEADLNRDVVAQFDAGNRNPRVVDHKLMMLIGDVKLGKRPQAVPTIVRLKALDLFERVRVDDVHRGGVELPRVALGEQRESGAAIRFSGEASGLDTFHRQTVGDVIQRAPHIVNGVTEDQRPELKRWRAERRVVQFCRAIRLVVTPTGFVLVPVEGSQLRIKKIQVALRPLELNPGAIEWAKWR